jgi:hypothetical protein
MSTRPLDPDNLIKGTLVWEGGSNGVSTHHLPIRHAKITAITWRPKGCSPNFVGLCGYSIEASQGKQDDNQVSSHWLKSIESTNQAKF